MYGPAGQALVVGREINAQVAGSAVVVFVVDRVLHDEAVCAEKKGEGGWEEASWRGLFLSCGTVGRVVCVSRVGAAEWCR